MALENPVKITGNISDIMSMKHDALGALRKRTAQYCEYFILNLVANHYLA